MNHERFHGDYTTRPSSRAHTGPKVAHGAECSRRIRDPGLATGSSRSSPTCLRFVTFVGGCSARATRMRSTESTVSRSRSRGGLMERRNPDSDRAFS